MGRKPKPDKNRKVKCKICERVFQRTNLRKHWKNKHPTEPKIKLDLMYNEYEADAKYDVNKILYAEDFDSWIKTGPLVKAGFDEKQGTSSSYVRLREVYSTKVWEDYLKNAKRKSARSTQASRDRAD